MSFNISRGANNSIVTTATSSSNTVNPTNNSSSVGLTGKATTADVNSLTLSGTLVTSTAAQINSITSTPGIATALKPMILDASSNITGIGSLECSSLTVNGISVTGAASGPQNTDLVNPYATSITPGVAAASKAVTLDANRNVTGINSIITNKLNLGGAVSLPVSNMMPDSVIAASTWANITTTATDTIWKAVCWSSTLSKFVAVGSCATAVPSTATSVDGTNWTVQPSIAGSWNNIVWSPFYNLFVACSSDPSGTAVMTSPDGVTWTARTTPNFGWKYITWIPTLNIFVLNGMLTGIGSTTHRIAKSIDGGITWTLVTHPAVQSTPSCYGYGAWSPSLSLYVVADNASSWYLTTSDFTTWTLNTNIILPSSRGMIWSANLGVFITTVIYEAYGSSYPFYASSSDGLNWVYQYAWNTATAYGSTVNGALLFDNTGSIVYSPELNITVFFGNNQTLILDNSNGNGVSNVINAKEYTVNIPCGLNSNAVWSPTLGIFICINSNSKNTLIKTSTVASSATMISNLPNVSCYTYNAPSSAVNWISNCWSSSLGLFVVVGSGTTAVATSTNGINWTVRTVSKTNLTSVCWSPSLGLFAASSNTSSTTSILTSSDGITWTPRTTPAKAFQYIIWVAVLNKFVAVSSTSGSGTTSFIITSSNGITWAYVTNPSLTTVTLGAPAWSPTLNLCVIPCTNTQQYLTTPDLVTFTLRTTLKNAFNMYWWVENSVFACLSTNITTSVVTYTYSTDGLAWTYVNIGPLTYLSYFPGIKLITTKYVLAGNYYLNFSTDGINWMTITDPLVNNNLTTGYSSNPIISYSSVLNKYVITGVATGINSTTPISLNSLTSTSNVMTTALSTSKNTNITQLNNILSYNPKNVYGLTNITGIQYTNINTFVGTATRCMIWASGLNKFILAPGNNYKGCISSDGKNYTLTNTTLGNTICICYSPYLKILTLGSTNGLFYSTDGLTWTQVNGTISGTASSICWSPQLKLFVATTNLYNSPYNSYIYNSTDGINWNRVVMPSLFANFGMLNSISWSAKLNLFVAIPSNGNNNNSMYITSTDGFYWSIQYCPLLATPICMFWCDALELFFIPNTYQTMGSNLLTSSDGLNWYANTNYPDYYMNNIIWASGLNLLVATDTNKNAIYTSADGYHWNQNINATYSSSCIAWSPSLGIFVNGNGYVFTPNLNVPANTIPDAALYLNPTNNYIGMGTETPGNQIEINSKTGNCLQLGYTGNTTSIANFDVLSTGQLNITLNGTTPIFNITASALSLNGTSITATTTEMSSYLTVTADTQSSGKILTTDASSNLNAPTLSLYCNSLNVNGASFTGFANPNPYLTTAAGTASPSTVLVVDSNRNITGINNISYSKLTLGSAAISTSTNVNLNVLQNNVNKMTCTSSIYNSNTLSYSWNSNTISYLIVDWSPELGIAIGLNSGSAAYSYDLQTWTSSTSSIPSYTWSSSCWSPQLSLFVAVCSSGNTASVLTSPDGITWTGRTTPGTNAWSSICWSTQLSLFVAVSTTVSTSGVMTSPNGITWTIRTTPSTSNYTICWAAELGLFVAVGTSSIIMTSSDGISWTGISNSIPLYSVCWSNDLSLFAAIGITSILTSSDGTTWGLAKTITSPTYSFPSLTWVPEYKAFMGYSQASYDGMNWFSMTNATSAITVTNTNIKWCDKYNVLFSKCITSSTVSRTQPLLLTNSNALVGNTSQISFNQSNGRLGLGTTTPGYQLHLSTDSAAKPSTAYWTVSSDARLKDDIQDADLEICYNNIKNIRLARYTWKDDVYTNDQISDRSIVGWIADEVEKVFPNAVTTTVAHGYDDCKDLNIDQLMATLYGFTQNLMDKNDKQDIIIDTLTQQVNKLEAFIDSLEIGETEA